MSKILIVTDAWQPQVNGVVTAFEKIKSILDESGHEVSVIHPGYFRTVPVFFYPEIRLSLFPSRFVGRKIIGEMPDHIHIATEGPIGLAARRFCVKKRIPFSTSFHTNFHQYLKLHLVVLEKGTALYLRWFHNAGTVCMASTESLRTMLTNMGIKRTALWPLGVDTNLFNKKETDESIALLPKPVFVYFGRLAKEKNVEECLKLNLPGSKLVIGDGPDRKKLEKKYAGKAHFIGYKKGRELVSALAACDVFVFPSRTDTFGLVVLEALALGIPRAGQ